MSTRALRRDLEAVALALRDLHALTGVHAIEGTNPTWEACAEWHDQLARLRERVEHLLSLTPEAHAA